jgi:hypothetical protein
MTAHSIFRTALAAIAMLPAAAFADGFDGTYEYGYCSGDAGAVALVIAGESATYYESPCTLSDATPQPEPEGAVQYTMSCDHGSGPTPETVLLSYNADGDLVMRTGDLEDRFVSCD